MATTRNYLDYLNDKVDISPANSQEELDASQLIESIMEEHGLDTSLQEFDAPSSPELPRSVLLVLMFLGMVLSGVLGSVIGLVGLALVLGPSVLLALRFGGRDLISGIGGRARSQNVIGIHRASGPLVVKGNRPIVIFAHYDSPNEDLLFQPPLARWQPLLMRSSLWCGIAAAFCSLVQIIAIIPAPIRHVLWALGILAALPLLLLGAAGIYGRFASCTTGANDNKASVAAMLGVLDKVRPADDVAKRWVAANPRSEVRGEVPVPGTVEKEPREESDKEASERAFASLDRLPTTMDDGERVAVDEIAPIVAGNAVHPATAAFTPQVIPAAEPEGPKSVRRGAKLIEDLQILPEGCQIVYQKPPVPQVVLPDLPDVDVGLDSVPAMASSATGPRPDAPEPLAEDSHAKATVSDSMSRGSVYSSEPTRADETIAEGGGDEEKVPTAPASIDAPLADFEVIDSDAPSRSAELLASVKSALCRVRELIPHADPKAPEVERGEESSASIEDVQGAPAKTTGQAEGPVMGAQGAVEQSKASDQTATTPVSAFEDEEALLAEVHARATGDTVATEPLAASEEPADDVPPYMEEDVEGGTDEGENASEGAPAPSGGAAFEPEPPARDAEGCVPYDGPMASQFDAPSVHDVESRRVDPARVPSINDAFLDNAAIFTRLKATPDPALESAPASDFDYRQKMLFEEQAADWHEEQDAPGPEEQSAMEGEEIQPPVQPEEQPMQNELPIEEAAAPWDEPAGSDLDETAEDLDEAEDDGGPTREQGEGLSHEGNLGQETEDDQEGCPEGSELPEAVSESVDLGVYEPGEPEPDVEHDHRTDFGEADAADPRPEAQAPVANHTDEFVTAIPEEPAEEEPLPQFSLFAPLRDDYIMDAEFERVGGRGVDPTQDPLDQTMVQTVIADGSDEPTLVTMPAGADESEEPGADELPTELEERTGVAAAAEVMAGPAPEEKTPDSLAAEASPDATSLDDERPERAVGYVLGEEPVEIGRSELALSVRPFVAAEDVKVVGGDDADEADQTLDPSATVIAPNLSFMEDEEPSEEELASKDVTGLDTYAMDGTEPRPAEPRKPEPAAIDDPNWGKSEFTPQAGNIARRSVLFDLPDPSEAVVDPLAPAESSSAPATRGIDDGRSRPSAADLSYTRGEREPLGVVSGGVLRTEVPRPRGGSHQMRPSSKKRFNIFGHHKDQEGDSDSMSSWLGVDDDFDAKKSGREIGSWDNFSEGEQKKPRGGWKGGATSRFDLRLVQEDPMDAAQGVDAEPVEGYALGGEETRGDAPQDGIGMEELREAITGMSDDELLAHDIWFVALGASGLDHAGAKRFMEEHRKDVRGAFVVNLGSVGAGRLSVLTSEGSINPRRADRRMVRMLSKIAADLHISLEKARHDWSDTDATPAMQSSMRAATIIGLSDDGVPALSHTSDDVPENVDAAQVVSVAELVAELIRRS